MRKSKKDSGPMGNEKSGIDKIIDRLVANRHQIGAIVVGLSPKAGAQLTTEEGGVADLCVMSADSVFANDDEERGAVGIRSNLTVGLSMQVHRKMTERRSLFG